MSSIQPVQTIERPDTVEQITEADWSVELAFHKSGDHHMKRDEQLAHELVDGERTNPILRLYSWNPPAVSIGYQQKMESIDLEACKAAGIDVVRRPTGGRAVLHIRELTYAVVMRASAQMGIYAAHNLIVEALLLSLSPLSDTSELSITGRSTDQPFRDIYREGTLTNAACFASSARHEVTYRGRKVIGSAQRRFGDVLLQHGSILLSPEHLRLPEFLAMPEGSRERMQRLLLSETATLSEIFARPIAPEEVANSVQSTFVSHICRLANG